MPWIEGIGDEVTVTICVLLVMCILVVSWLSTGIREIPFISVIIVQLTRRREVPTSDGDTSQTGAQSNDGDSNETDINQSEGGQADENTAEVLATVSTRTVSSENVETESDTGNLVEPPVAVITDRSISASSEFGTTAKGSADESDDAVGSSVDGSEGNNETNEIAESINHTCTEQVPASCPLSSSELRQRRLNFFSGTNTERSACDTCTSVTAVGSAVSESEPKTITATENEKASTSEHGYKDSKKTCSPNEPKQSPLSKFASNLLSENLSSSEAVITNSTADSQSGVPISETVNSEQTGNQSESGSSLENQSQTGITQSEPDIIRIRIKFLNDTQRLVTASANETIGNFRRRHFSTELSQSKLVRFIFNGQDLRNDASTLESYNIGDNSVLHCLVTQQPAEPQNRHQNEDEGMDIGLFMFPLFGLLLGIVWYTRLMYRQFFNVTSTLTLGGITFLYIAALMSSLRGHRQHEHID